MVAERVNAEQHCQCLLWEEQFAFDQEEQVIFYSVQVNDKQGYAAVLRHIASNRQTANKLFFQLAERADRVGAVSDIFADLRVALVDELCFS